MARHDAARRAAGGLDHGVSRLQLATLLTILDDGAGQAILHAGQRVEILQLGLRCGDDPRRAPWDQDLLALGLSHIVTPSRRCFGQLEITIRCFDGKDYQSGQQLSGSKWHRWCDPVGKWHPKS